MKEPSMSKPTAQNREEGHQRYRVTLTEVRVYTMEIGSCPNDQHEVEAWARTGWQQSEPDTRDLQLIHRHLVRVVALPVPRS